MAPGSLQGSWGAGALFPDLVPAVPDRVVQLGPAVLQMPPSHRPLGAAGLPQLPSSLGTPRWSSSL